MKILANEATINTAAVEVKALTISGKQLTLAVFRQLEEEDALQFDEDEPLYFGGEIWGRVNYHPDCRIVKEHHHYIWQKGKELRRGTMRKDCAGETTFEKMMYALHMELIWQCIRARAQNLPLPHAIDGAGRLERQIGGKPMVRIVADAERSAIRDPLLARAYLSKHPQAREISDVDQMEQDIADYRGEWQWNWDQLSDVTQLFIAV